MRFVGAGHGLFAIAAAALAVLSLVYGEFALIWADLPSWFPWRDVWVYGSALLVLAASAGACLERTAPASVLVIGGYLAAWLATRAGLFLVKPVSIGAWYGVCEALTPLLGASVLYATLRPHAGMPATPAIMGARALRVAQVLFGLDCVVYGVAHFAYAGYTASMVPAWLPGPLGIAYLTGLAHAAAGLALVVGIVPRLAATLEAIMMSLFGVLVWVPTLFARSVPEWAGTPKNRWSEFVVTLLLAASAWIVAAALRGGSLGSASRSRS